MEKVYRYAAKPKPGILITLVVLYIQLSSTNSAVSQPRCDYRSCTYYSMLTYQASSLFQLAGLRFFQNCTCNRYGVTLPAKFITSTPQPSTSTGCGISQLTGSATQFLRSNAGRVVGGTAAAECKYPWVVHVISGLYQCGGSIIDNRHIVTAAHCLRSGNYLIPASQVEVGVGSSNKTKLSYYKVQLIDRHPNYNPSTFDYDIAVLTLQFPLPDDNPCMKPICLPSPGLSIEAGVQCVVAGWGAQIEGSRRGSTSLQEAVIPIMNQDACSSAYGDYMMNERKLCAGYSTGGIDACQGDSGGPFMCAKGDSWVLAGLVSFGNGCARPDNPGVYANVMNLKSWLDRVII
ncbi:transmembrane protease serine 9 [Patella vulgata]|uniref:transmembrane protease serine 9 n=1 Tax=Patella vulgata TaxID=6465 RepID=UPI0024A989DE|nr:transmembrane protease serine 9 [Patella vulgata]